jgi:hypothetical protein
MLSTCRFNDLTWEENCKYREKWYGSISGSISISGPIYGVPMRMREIIPLDILVFVVEMNNSQNKIEGIGLIKNKIVIEQKHYIYSDQNYNRYIYKGDYRISREILQQYNLKLVSILDYILFKGKTHLKRGNGFMRIPDKLLYCEKAERMEIVSEIKSIFLKHFTEKECIKEII